MKVNFKKILTILCLFFALSLSSFSQNYWNKVIEAIIAVESEGNCNARNGQCVGPMQISPVCVRECNQILKEKKSTKRYTLADRYNLQKSKEMFLLIQEKHNSTNNVEKAIRSWNGGPNYTIAKTNKYYKKVLARM